jgi:hypothetical protein
MRFTLLFAAVIGLLLLVGCREGIILSAPSDELVEGFCLDVKATPTDCKDHELVWSSSDTLVASVDQEGRVLGCAPGQVEISARSADTGAVGTLALRVVPDEEFNTQLPVAAAPFAPTFERSCSLDRCEVNLHLSGIAATVAKARFRRYHQLELPQAGTLGEVGCPELPFFTLYFAIPLVRETHAPATWSVDVERELPMTYEGIRPWPHQPPWWIDGQSEEADAPPPFVVDEASYEAEEAWPPLTYAVDTVVVGNLPLLEVKVVPLRYLPAERVLELHQTTRVVVSFQSDGELVMPRPVGDYKGIQERGADELVSVYVQNRELLDPVSSGDLTSTLPPYDTVDLTDMPFDLLIVTRPALIEPARRLARYRQDHGTRVWLASVSEAAYPDADAILDMIQTFDDINRLEETGGFRPHAMRAVLLFGDVEHIPTFEGLTMRTRELPGPGDDPVPVAATDLPYSTLRGIDWRADVALGRISVDDDAEGHVVVDKIEAYEGIPADQYPHHMAVYGYFDDEAEQRTILAGAFTFGHEDDRVLGDWYDSFLGQVHPGDLVRPDETIEACEGSWHARVRSVSRMELQLWAEWPGESAWYDSLQVAFQDGQDDWRFLRAAERVRDFMSDLGVTVRFGYNRNEEPAPAPAPERDYDGTDLPPDLLDYAWDCDAADIMANWAEGLDGIVLHSDHGAPEGWNHPWIRSWDLIPLGAAGVWYPIVFSINCSSGYFDSETDRIYVWNGSEAELVVNDATAGYWSQHDESFCEELLRFDGGGAVAAVGASRGTSSKFNDALIDGLFAAFYTEYDRGVIPEGPGTRYAYEYLGDAVRAGKFRMRTWTASATGGNSPKQAEYNLQAYNLFGDPMLRIRPPRPPDE